MSRGGGPSTLIHQPLPSLEPGTGDWGPSPINTLGRKGPPPYRSTGQTEAPEKARDWTKVAQKAGGRVGPSAPALAGTGQLDGHPGGPDELGGKARGSVGARTARGRSLGPSPGEILTGLGGREPPPPPACPAPPLTPARPSHRTLPAPPDPSRLQPSLLALASPP